MDEARFNANNDDFEEVANDCDIFKDEDFPVSTVDEDADQLLAADVPVLHVNGPSAFQRPQNFPTYKGPVEAIVDVKFNDLSKNAEDISITVGSPHKVVTNLETFVNYSVETNTNREEFPAAVFKVRRRYNDFVWLRERLEEKHQMLIVPPLPRKHPLTSTDRYGGLFIERRCRGLHNFLSRISSHPVLSSDKDFIAFLTKESGQNYDSWKRSHPSTSSSSFLAASLSRLSSSLVAAVSPSGSASPVHSAGDSEFASYTEHASAFAEAVARLERTALRLTVEWTNVANDLRELHGGLTRWGAVRGPSDRLADALNYLGESHRSCAESIHPALTEAIEDEFGFRMQEYGLYTEAVQRVLRRRGNVEEAFEDTNNSLRRTKDDLESPLNPEIGSFSRKLRGETVEQEKERKQKRAEQLSNRSDHLQDRLACANADLKSDLDRWMTIKRGDMRESLIILAKSHITHHKNCQNIWLRAVEVLVSQKTRNPSGAC